jgi:predicted ATP-dependent serine protease
MYKSSSYCQYVISFAGPARQSTLAAELDMDLTQTSCIVREVTSCLQPQDNNSNNYNNNNTEEPFAVALPPIVTAHEYLAQERKCRGHIVTFCKRIDTLLGGGISLGSLTELAGLPGTGKTQLAMQLCVNARLPTRLGGVRQRRIS